MAYVETNIEILAQTVHQNFVSFFLVVLEYEICFKGLICDFYFSAVSVTGNLCTEKRNSSNFEPKIRGL